MNKHTLLAFPPFKALNKIRHKVKQAFNPPPEPSFKFHCPICDQKSHAFYPIDPSLIDELKFRQFRHGLDKFETLELHHYTCPHCYANDRERLYALYLSKQQKYFPKNQLIRILDIAPATSLSRWIKKQGCYKYRSCDLFMENVDDKVDIMNMNLYEDGSFDCLICSHVLEHVADDKKAVKELYRILSSNGWAIMMVPISLMIEETYENPEVNSDEDRVRHFAQNDHVRLYSKQGFLKLLKDQGFKVESYTIKDFDDYSFYRHGIDPKSVLYIAKKS